MKFKISTISSLQMGTTTICEITAFLIDAEEQIVSITIDSAVLTNKPAIKQLLIEEYKRKYAKLTVGEIL